jgi:hypothetical protein
VRASIQARRTFQPSSLDGADRAAPQTTLAGSFRRGYSRAEVRAYFNRR